MFSQKKKLNVIFYNDSAPCNMVVMEFSFESVVYFLYKLFCFYEVARLRPFKDHSEMTEFSGQHLLMQHSTSLITAYFYDKMAVDCSHYMYVVRQFKWKHGPLLRTLDEQGN